MKARFSLWLAFLAGLLPLCAATDAAQTKARPNILWLIAEDFGPHLGCYGTRQVWTPNRGEVHTSGNVTPGRKRIEGVDNITERPAQDVGRMVEDALAMSLL